MGKTQKKGGLNFEASLKKLEQIVRKLEDDKISLDESLKLFEEGKKLTQACEAELQEAENRVRLLMEDSSGELKDEAFDPEGTPKPGNEADEDSSGNTKDDIPF